jgi:hypothetical protein
MVIVEKAIWRHRQVNVTKRVLPDGTTRILELFDPGRCKVWTLAEALAEDPTVDEPTDLEAEEPEEDPDPKGGRKARRAPAVVIA